MKLWPTARWERAVRATVAEEIALAIEQRECAPLPSCQDRRCPDCVRYAKAEADAAIARRIGGQL